MQATQAPLQGAWTAKGGWCGSMKNGDVNRRAQFQRRKELKQENERIRSLLLLPMFLVNDLRCARCERSLDNGCPHRRSSACLSGIGAIKR
jgi:hypothetical protein